jgi:hypothetical protein
MSYTELKVSTHLFSCPHIEFSRGSIWYKEIVLEAFKQSRWTEQHWLQTQWMLFVSGPWLSEGRVHNCGWYKWCISWPCQVDCCSIGTLSRVLDKVHSSENELVLHLFGRMLPRGDALLSYKSAGIRLAMVLIVAARFTIWLPIRMPR